MTALPTDCTFEVEVSAAAAAMACLRIAAIQVNRAPHPEQKKSKWEEGRERIRRGGGRERGGQKKSVNYRSSKASGLNSQSS